MGEQGAADRWTAPSRSLNMNEGLRLMPEALFRTYLYNGCGLDAAKILEVAMAEAGISSRLFSLDTQAILFLPSFL